MTTTDPSATEPHRTGLPAIDLAAARVLFRTAESSGLGRTGTDEILQQWLDGGFDLAFYRNAERPLQVRAVEQCDQVPQWLCNSRVGKARLEAVCLNPVREKPSSEYEADSAPPEEPEPGEPTEQAEPAGAESEEAKCPDAAVCHCMPGLCWCGAPDEQGWAQVENRQGGEDGGGGGDDAFALRLVYAYARGMAQDPSYDLTCELPRTSTGGRSGDSPTSSGPPRRNWTRRDGTPRGHGAVIGPPASAKSPDRPAQPGR